MGPRPIDSQNTSLYDDTNSKSFQNPEDLKELIEAAPELPLFNEKLPFDNRSYIIPLYKPTGISSFDVIREVRSKIISSLGKGKGRRKLKIGHFGTLDPFAEGILLVGTGKAMKLMPLIQEELPKTYCAKGNIGIKTFTGDRDGDVMGEVVLDTEELETLYPKIYKASEMLRGEYWQAPPYYSAVKHEGKPLYEYAREGIFIDKPPVKREIYHLEISNCSGLEFDFTSKVSNGTYIRTLWQDMLSAIDGHGHLTQLIREVVGGVEIKDTLTPEKFKAYEGLAALSPDQVIPLAKVDLNLREALDILQGRSIDNHFGLKDQQYWFFYKSILLGLGEQLEASRELKIKTLLFGLDKNS